MKNITNQYMELNTGDLLLFNDKTTSVFRYFTDLIKWGTHSNYTHVAMVLKDPTFIHPSLTGTYVWESSYEGKPDPQDGKVKLGVQITPLSEILESYRKTNSGIYVRKLIKDRNPFTVEKLTQIHDVVYDKPYDIVPTDWIGALFKKDSEPQKTSRFWCSALVGYIYTQAGILPAETDWSILTPADFSLDGQTVIPCSGFKLDSVQTKI